MKKLFLLVLVAVTATGCSRPRPDSGDDAHTEVLHANEVTWEKLNPARGDQSPKAATLWGDRQGKEATGFLVQFVDGFSSPPHTHNVSYRGVVISGSVHNDDPATAKMWMPPGSFWTQPKGEVHITAAKGETNVAYIEIEEGPYLVLPVEKAFDSDERPVNIDKSNLVWLDATNARTITSKSPNGPEIAFLWGHPGDGQLNGSLIKLPSGFRGEIRTNDSLFRAVVIQGQLFLQRSDESTAKPLEPGSSFSSNGRTVHQIACGKGEECLLYVRAYGTFKLVQPRS